MNGFDIETSKLACANGTDLLALKMALHTVDNPGRRKAFKTSYSSLDLSLDASDTDSGSSSSVISRFSQYPYHTLDTPGLLTELPIITLIFNHIRNLNGFIMVYGGVVRSLYRANNNKDLDLLIANIGIDELTALFGPLHQTRFRTANELFYRTHFHGLPIDICLCLQPFQTHIDFLIHYEKKTRDQLRIDSLGLLSNPMEAISMEYIIMDRYGAKKDIEKGLLQLCVPQLAVSILKKNPSLLLRIIRFMAEGYDIAPNLLRDIPHALSKIDFKTHAGHLLALYQRYFYEPYALSFFKMTAELDFIRAFILNGIPIPPITPIGITLMTSLLTTLKTLPHPPSKKIRYETLLARLILPYFIIPVQKKNSVSLMFHPLGATPITFFKQSRSPVPFGYSRLRDLSHMKPLLDKTARDITQRLQHRLAHRVLTDPEGFMLSDNHTHIRYKAMRQNFFSSYVSIETTCQALSLSEHF